MGFCVKGKEFTPHVDRRSILESLLIKSFQKLQFLEEFLGNPETIYRSRYSAIDGCLEEDLHYFLFATSIIQGSPQMQFHFVRPIESSQHSQVNKTAGLT
jgi:hypothetical protein